MSSSCWIPSVRWCLCCCEVEKFELPSLTLSVLRAFDDEAYEFEVSFEGIDAKEADDAIDNDILC